MASDPPAERPRTTLLVVDDDEDLRTLLVHLLRQEARSIDQASSAAAARQRLTQRHYDVVITDLSMPDESGLSLMQWALEKRPGAEWIVLTGHGTLDAAVKALQLGAFDFLEKPLPAVEPLQKSVRNALAQRRLRAERDRLHAELERSHAQLSQHVQELEQAYRMLSERADSMRADLHRAGIIQRALLPHVVPRLEGIRVHALYRPSQSVGGDIYDVVRLDKRHVVVLIADAAGHGLAAAMLAVLFRSQLDLVDPDSGVPRRPAEMLRVANRSLCEGLAAPGLFLTAACCLIDTGRATARVASAGHPPLLLLRAGGGVERIFHTGPALGLDPGADYAEQQVSLESGDRLFFYSDGVYEWLPEGRMGDAALSTLHRTRGEGLELLRNALHLDARGDAEPEDDTTLLMLEAASGSSQLDNGCPRPLPAPAPRRDGTCEIEMGCERERTIFSIHGRADWTRSAIFHAECVSALEAGRGVIVDLARCNHLDSTFLGAFHELSERAEEADLEFRLQGVSPDLEALFRELGMTGLMEHVVPRMLPLPTRMQPLAGSAPPDSRAMLTLRAHERLAAISERNRREFDPLVALLRREVAGNSG